MLTTTQTDILEELRKRDNDRTFNYNDDRTMIILRAVYKDDFIFTFLPINKLFFHKHHISLLFIIRFKI